MVPTADLQVVRDFRRENNYAVFDYAKMGACCDFRHSFVIRPKGSMPKKCYMVLQHIPESSVLVWPCEI